MNNIYLQAGLISIFSFLFSLYICGYTITYQETKFISLQTEKEDYSISFSLANGNHIGMTLLFSVGLLSLLYILYKKIYKDPTFKNDKTGKILFYIGLILLLTIFSLLISMIFYSPYTDQARNFNDKIKDEHYIVAVVAFLSNLIFANFIAFFMLHRSKKYVLFYLTIFIEIAFFLSLIGDVEYADYIKKRDPNNNYNDVYFPIAENINYLFMIYNIILLTFVSYCGKILDK